MKYLFQLLPRVIGDVIPGDLGGGEVVDPGFSVTPWPNGWILAGIIVVVLVIAFVVFRLINRKKKK